MRVYCVSLWLIHIHTRIVNKYFVDYTKHSQAPIVVVGTKIDLLNDQGTLRSLREKKQCPLTTNDGIQLARDIGAVKYLECSSLTGQGVNEVFEEVAIACLDSRKVPKYNAKSCNIS